MNIIIIDHNNRLIQFEANLLWAHEFLLNTRLFSKNTQEVQSYIDKALTNSILFSHLSKAGASQIYDLNDKSIHAQIPAESLALSLKEHEEKGMLMVDCVRKKVVSMCELDEGPIGEFDSINIQCYHRRAPHHNNKRPELFSSLKEQQAYIARLNELFEHNYWTNYEPGTIDILPEAGEAIHKIHALLKADLEKGTFDEPYLNQKDNVYMVLNPKTTGWDFQQSLNPGDTYIYVAFVRTLFEAGLVFTETQEKDWQESYIKYDVSCSSPQYLDLKFLKIAREKEMLSGNVKNAALNHITGDSTKSTRHKI